MLPKYRLYIRIPKPPVKVKERKHLRRCLSEFVARFNGEAARLTVIAQYRLPDLHGECNGGELPCAKLLALLQQLHRLQVS